MDPKTGLDKCPPTGIRYPDRPARSQSLYRLSYRAHAHYSASLSILQANWTAGLPFTDILQLLIRGPCSYSPDLGTVHHVLPAPEGVPCDYT